MKITKFHEMYKKKPSLNVHRFLSILRVSRFLFGSLVPVVVVDICYETSSHFKFQKRAQCLLDRRYEEQGVKICGSAGALLHEEMYSHRKYSQTRKKI